MKQIQLGGHKGPIRGWALVDDEDYEFLAQWRWSLIQGYAARSAWPERRVVLMHRAILGLEPGDTRQADHMSRDRLDNRRANLRIVSQAENNQNMPARKGTSRYRGVRKNRTYWQAYAVVDGKFHHLGCYEDEDHAGEVARSFREQRMAGAVD